jgi:Fe-S-cluster formation regulator IscX/YfhJ
MNTRLQQPPVQKAASLSDMPVGATLEFWYRGNGDHPEQYRHVQVTEIRDNGILAEDTEYGGTKMFLNSQAGDIDIVDDIPDTSWRNAYPGSDFDIRTVNFVDARQQICDESTLDYDFVQSLSGEQLAKLYKAVNQIQQDVVFDNGVLKVGKQMHKTTAARFIDSIENRLDVTDPLILVEIAKLVGINSKYIGDDIFQIEQE